MLSDGAQAAQARCQSPHNCLSAGRCGALGVLPGGQAGLRDGSGGSRLTQSPGGEASDFKMAPGRRPPRAPLGVVVRLLGLCACGLESTPPGPQSSLSS